MATVYSPATDISGKPLSGDAWNSVWNKNWNTAWNEGYNQAKAMASQGTDPVYSGGDWIGAQQGFYQGVQDYYNQNPNVLGTSDSRNTTNNSLTTPTSPTAPTPTNNTSSYDPYAGLRNEINSGYDDYFSRLDSLMGGLNDQSSAQNQILQNSYNQGTSDLKANKEMGMVDLDRSAIQTEQTQVKNLRDLASNIQNQYKAGQAYLGSVGAGDSSAANQYSYALNRMGTRERSNLMQSSANNMSLINDRKAKLNTIYTQEMSRLDTDFSNKKLEVTQWLADAQNQLRQMYASGELNKYNDLQELSTSALNLALQEYEAAKSNFYNRQNQLQTWALNNATTVKQAANNLASVSQLNLIQPSFVPSSYGTNRQTTSSSSLFGYGQREQKYDIFGNPITV